MYHYAARGANMHKKSGEDWTCSSKEKITDTHRQTDRQTDTLITILRFPIGSRVITEFSTQD